MTSPLVRLVGSDYLPAIMPVMTGAFDAQYGEAWTEAQCLGVMSLPGASLLIIDAAAVTGFALSRTIVGECELMLLAVLPDVQQRGHGRALLDAVVAEARTNNATGVFLEVRNGNSAVSLYSAAGFKEVGRRRDYYRGVGGQIFDALTYRMLLT